MMKLERAATLLPAHSWQLLPLRFHRIDADSVVLTNLVGEHVFVTPDELSTVVSGTCADQERHLANFRPGMARFASLNRLGHVDGGDAGWSAEQDLWRGDLSSGRERECLGVSADLRRVVVDLGLYVCR
jgi:hypothetical protein